MHIPTRPIHHIYIRKHGFIYAYNAEYTGSAIIGGDIIHSEIIAFEQGGELWFRQGDDEYNSRDVVKICYMEEE